MKAMQGQKVMDGAEPFLEAGERVLAGIVAQARGHTTAAAGGLGVASEIGHHKAGKQMAAAAEAGLVVKNPMGVVVTDRRLMTLSISTPWGFGMGGNVKELLSAIPIADVDDIEVKRLGVGKKITITVRGTEFKLEAGAGADAQGLAEALRQTRGLAAQPVA
jgi:hypothetical protein